MADLKCIGLLLLSLSPAAVFAGDFCYTYGSTLEYCDWGCCDDGGVYDTNTYCCEDSQVGVIVGAVIGCVALVAIIVGVVVAICCCCRKGPGRQGVVYQNNAGTTSTTTTATNMYGMPNAQMMYGQPAPYPGMAPIQTGYMAPGVNNPNMQQGMPMEQKWQEPPPMYEQLQPQPNQQPQPQAYQQPQPQANP